VSDGLTILEQLEHRGAVSGDGRTGDGAGLLCRIPYEFFERELGAALPAGNAAEEYADGLPYAVGMFFLPRSIEAGRTARSLVEYIASREGLPVLAWRDVPIVPQVLGTRGAASLPGIAQAAFAKPAGVTRGVGFERALYSLRKRIESEARIAGFSLDDFSIPSLSSRTIVYKGMFVAAQFASFYPDLRRPDFKSPFSIVHQRYSTNTFPSWPLAQPFRMIAHNGEINTLKKNINAMRARQASLGSEHFKADIEKLFPVIQADGSDSSMFDNVFELLVQSGRTPEHAFMMMVPESLGFEGDDGRRAFHEYHAAVMESWDGPAAMVFTDGLRLGAASDRNGLRPFRYLRTRDGRFIGASEAGALLMDDGEVIEKGKLSPGRMLALDLGSGSIKGDDRAKAEVYSRRPYRSWLAEKRLSIEDFPPAGAALAGGPPGGMASGAAPDSTAVMAADPDRLERYFGFDAAALRALEPMLKSGKEGIHGMGSRKQLAALSDRPDSFFSYFRQLFAQVTNPPMDHVREGGVMSLEGYIGRELNLLDESPGHCVQLAVKSPLLSNVDLARLRAGGREDYRVCTVSIAYPLGGRDDATAPAPGSRLKAAIEAIRTAVELRVDEGYSLVVLSDRGVGPGFASVPALLALSAANLALIAAGKRHRTGLAVETGEAREIHHVAALIGYGASAVNPWMAFDHIARTAAAASGAEEDGLPAVELARLNYSAAIEQGLLKTMSKMGVCSISSYRGGGLYEALGLSRELVAAYFPGTESRVGGIGLELIEEDIVRRHREAFSAERDEPPPATRKEERPWPPRLAALLARAVRDGDEEAYRGYAQGITGVERPAFALRDIFELRPGSPLPLAEVQSAEELVSRFSVAAMSVGALSREAHEALAAGANAIGSWSDCGEGGEDEARLAPGPDGRSSRSASRQIASGRFGVTARYLALAGELQIKMAQGAKPGEGGHLPGKKVNGYIARLRHVEPGTALISPPPHHDIYSIEDLSQLVHDLRCINPTARMAIKLAAQAGLGAVAAGAAKAGVDCVVVSSWDGGTGAAPQSSLDYAGGPWELSLPEIRQVLAMNDLSDRVSIQVDGRLRGGRDVVIAAILGAREFAFGTAALIAMGCIACGGCSEGRCPVGIATQDEELRAKFAGKPEHLSRLFHFIAEETRGILSFMGFRSLDELAGRYDALDYHGRDRCARDASLDFSKITEALEIAQRSPAAWSEFGDEAAAIAPPPAGLPAFLSAWRPGFKLPELEADIIEPLARAVAEGEPFRAELALRNSDRSIGAALSGELVRRGLDGAANPATLVFRGSAGQSFGAFLVPSLSFELEGEANDFVGKGLSGGVVAILGPIGVNLGAGMSGGVIFALDEEAGLDTRIAAASVRVSALDDDERSLLLALVTKHRDRTASPKAARLLDDWKRYERLFFAVKASGSCRDRIRRMIARGKKRQENERSFSCPMRSRTT
jgi:glutamate synthase (NADPH) large chain